MKVLPIPTCQHVVTCERCGPGTMRTPPRLCGEPSVAVIRHDDGQERFVCRGHLPGGQVAAAGAPWRLHHREVAAGPVKRAVLGQWSRGRNGRKRSAPPRREFSPEAREHMAAGQRERWRRIHEAEAKERAS